MSDDFQAFELFVDRASLVVVLSHGRPNAIAIFGSAAAVDGV